MAFSGQKISAGYLKAYKMSCISITFLTQCELMFPGLPINESQLYEMFIPKECKVTLKT